MSRLQLIENALVSINESLFQELCDSFLIIRNNNYRVFSRVGSQSGKQKTIKGTPDTFLLLPNGKYIFVEYSTNVTSGISKLKEDIKKCIDFDKTGIDPSFISEIILCINFNLKPVQIEELREELLDTRIVLTIYTLDALALELHLHHRDLANQYLGIHLDTGQIISIDHFIEEYNKVSKGIATPLDNPFLHRESELKSVIEFVKSNDFVILTGAPGVGKTKLALEAMKLFLEENDSFNAYCVSYKSHQLLGDLYQYLDSNKNYLLFVDDANRIDAFNQISGFYRGSRKGKLKLIITVRDYAYQEIEYLCRDFSPVRIDLNKFNDDQIKDIIISDPLGILNPDFQKPIINIADGNPRIAIMTAMLAKQKQDVVALSDLTELFERYFLTFIRDEGEFAKAINIKTLGLISFFYTLPFKNKEVLGEVLNAFEIEYNDFIDSIDKLEKLELVEIQYEYVKIPEQNLSTYFFYKAFIKDKLLSFSVLLNNYYDKNSNRFKDSVIPANNTFGPERVMSVLRPELKRYYNSIIENQDKSYQFLSTFWFYLKDETFEYIYTEIQNTNQSVFNEYNTDYVDRKFQYSKDPIIELVGEFFKSHDNFKNAIDLSLEYARKKPEVLAELIYKFIEKLTFDLEDEKYGFFRQSLLVDILSEGAIENDIISAKCFFEVSKFFLKFKFNHTKGARHNFIYFYDYFLPNDKYILAYRQKIWDVTNKLYDVFPEDALGLLQNYSNGHIDLVNSIMKKDISMIVKIIENHLDKNDFLDCQFVQNLISWAKSESIKNPVFEYLIRTFTNPTYVFFTKIEWDRYKNREMFEFNDLNEYERLKENEIRINFTFKSTAEILDFYSKFKYLKKISKKGWHYNRSLEIILDQNSLIPEISLEILKIIIFNKNEVNFYPRAFFYNQLKSSKMAEQIYLLITKDEFEGKASWLMTFFESIDESVINSRFGNDLIKMFEVYNNFGYIFFDRLEKFLKLNSTLFQRILEIVVFRNENEDARIQFWMNTFEKYFDHLGNDIELIMKAYIQQDYIQNDFDHEGKSFLRILKGNSNFLFGYVKAKFIDGQLRISSDSKNLNFVWEIDNIEKEVKLVFDFVIENEYYFGIGNHFCNTFFRNVKSEFESKAENFLVDYCKENFTDSKRMNIIVDITRNSLRNMYEPILLLFLSLNQDSTKFAEIYWRGNFTKGSGDMVLSDIQAADWQNILLIVEKSQMGIKLLGIKKYINTRIENCLEAGNLERQRRFLQRN